MTGVGYNFSFNYFDILFHSACLVAQDAQCKLILYNQSEINGIYV